MPATALALSLAVFLFVPHAPPAMAQMMTTPGKFDVSGTGAATYGIPIAVPPGTAGMTPGLTLSYSSQGGNGIVGVGWSLSGLPSVTRCPQTFAQDGIRGGGITYTANDRFCLDGQRLMAISGTYGADGTEYRTEIESFTRVISHGTAGNGPAWFEVHTKSGQIMEFGHTTDSLVLAQGKPTARSWAVDKVSDTKGNYYSVTYTNDNANGQAYPIEIDYTGNTAASLTPYNKVKFVYDFTRPDVVPAYQAGSLIKTTVRLTDIQTYVGASLVADYKIAYQQSPSTQRSRPTSVTLCDGSGNCLPATTLAWTDIPASSFAQPAVTLNGQYGTGQGWSDNNANPRFLVDVNGDGLPDIVGFKAPDSSGNGGGVYVSLNTGTAFAAPSYWLPNQYGWSDNNTYPRFVVDVNGDGLPDIVGFGFVATYGSTGSSGVFVSLNTGTSFAAPTLWLSSQYITAQGWSDNNTYPRFLVDVNGDGLPDIVGFSGGGGNGPGAGVYVSLNTGVAFAAPTLWSNQYQGWSDNNTNPRYLMDVNGDGLPDIGGFGFVATYGSSGSGGVFVSLNTGTSFAAPTLWLNNQYTTAQGWSDNNTYPRFLVDVNGDGLPDIVGFSGGGGNGGPGAGVYVSLNTGVGFTAPTLWSNQYQGWSDNNTSPRYLMDVNGDGLPDIVGFGFVATYGSTGSGGVFVSLNTGTSFAAPTLWLSSQYTTAQGWSDNNTYPRFLVDVNGDGLPDIVGFSGSGVQTSLNPVNSGTTWPDLVGTVTSGLGATAAINYKPLTAPSIYTKDTGDTVPIVDVIAPVYVVSRVDTSNGIGGTYTTYHGYFGAKADLSGRGFLGFRRLDALDPQTNILSTTNFRQDFPYIGLTASTGKTLGSQGLSYTANTYQFSNASGAATVSTPSNAGAPYQVSVAQSIASSADLDGTAVPTVTTTSQYDTYGNPTQIVVSTSDGFSKTTTNTYTNDTTNWFLGRLTTATVTSQIPASGGPPPVLPPGVVDRPPAVVTHDFDGDGKSDIAWLDTSGNAAVWLMNGAQLKQSAGVGAAPGWSIVGQRDFDGDGKSDILWRDSSGNVAIWFMNGAQLKQVANVVNVPTTWSIVGTGDFNGDGKGDILWHDTSGNVAIYFMNGAQFTSAGVATVPTTWSIVGTGDFNGDGMTDILWHDTSGNVAIYFMNGAQVTSAGVGNASTAWSIVGTGDFNGDGKSDILWRDTSGNVAIWFMNGAEVLQIANVGSAATNWSVAETGDYNGDGKSDILWRDSSTGNVSIWFMNGAQIAQSAGAGSQSTAWSIQGVNVD